MLKELLENKTCFKLICGAGNENLQEVERLVTLYAASGCHFFDLSADKNVLFAAQKGLEKGLKFNSGSNFDLLSPSLEIKDFGPSAREGQKINDYHFCISFGTKNDQHMQKAKINSDKCKKCGVCVAVCPQNAVNGEFQIVENYCIGCFRCKAACEFSAIDGYSKNKPIDLSIYQLDNLSCIELHVSDEADALRDWDYLCENFDGMLSICIARGKFSNESVLNLIKKMVEKRAPYTTIIQADGAPMSGGEDDYKTTLQAVAMGELVQKAQLPAYVLLSGGTNSKTAQLAKLCGVDFNGIAVGSYARKIVKNYIEREDFLENKLIFREAQKIAADFIGKC